MRIRRFEIKGFRGIRQLCFSPGMRTVILGPNNSGKTTILEALDLLLHSGRGRSRPPPTEIDYFGRDPANGFAIEAVIGDLPDEFCTEARRYLEGWIATSETLIPDVDGEGVEAVVRVRVRGTPELDVLHEFAKDEAEGARFHPTYRAHMGWIFDGRTRDPVYQLGFYQGGVLDRLFADSDLHPAIAGLRDALGAGANAVNSDTVVEGKLLELALDLQRLGLIEPSELPAFEVGAVSPRELLQALRLTLPGGGTHIPLFRQGRGAQRLLLVAVLLRLAQAAGRPLIGGFEEPEEALEPIRQAQIARILGSIAEEGGQVFVVTHSPEIARAFCIEDFILLDERAAGAGAKPLRKLLSQPVRQKYERWLDGAVVRALFARVPLLVEGPSDRAIINVFWDALVRADLAGPRARPREQIGLDFINCESAPEFRMMTRLLKEAGKTVVVWVERDVPDILSALRADGHAAALLLHDPSPGRQTLEHALAQSASLNALVAALENLAGTRGYPWQQQCMCIVSSLRDVNSVVREKIKAAGSVGDALGYLSEAEARSLIGNLLAASGVTPFEMKGGRQGRIVAESIVAVDQAVPASFANGLLALNAWLSSGAVGQIEIQMQP